MLLWFLEKTVWNKIYQLTDRLRNRNKIENAKQKHKRGKRGRFSCTYHDFSGDSENTRSSKSGIIAMYYYCLKDGEERGDHGWKPSKEWDTSKPGDLGWAVGIRTLAPSRREEQQVQKDRQTED